MKNRIINGILLKMNDDRSIFYNNSSCGNKFEYKGLNQTSKQLITSAYTQHESPTYAEITKRKYPQTNNATVILKTDMESKADRKKFLKLTNR